MKKHSLLYELKWTIFILTTALLAMWLICYANLHKIVSNYILQNMEIVSAQILNELENSLLHLEEISFLLSDNEEVASFLQEKNQKNYYEKASTVENIIDKQLDNAIFMDHIILYNEYQQFYRFSGNLSNTNIQRLMNVVKKDDLIKHIQIRLNGTNFIGYVANINYEGFPIGKVLMLSDENDIYQLFSRVNHNNNLIIALAVEEKIVISNEITITDFVVADFMENKDYILYKQIGFTPFQLIISYDNTENIFNWIFWIIMLFIGIFLFALLQIFMKFWKQKFFYPIQKIINNVEEIGRAHG